MRWIQEKNNHKIFIGGLSGIMSEEKNGDKKHRQTI